METNNSHLPGSGGAVLVWDARTGERVAAMPGHEWPVTQVTFSPGGRWIVSAGFDAHVLFWDARTHALAKTIAGPSPVQAIAFSPDGRRLVTAAVDAVATVWDPSTGRELVRLVGHGGGPIGDVAFLPDGDRVVTSGLDGTTRVWNVSAAGARDWVTVPGVEQIFAGVAFSPEGSVFAAPAHPRGVTLWDSRTGEEVTTLSGPPQKLTNVAFSPDGTRLVAASDVTAAPPVWDVESGELLFTLEGIRARSGTRRTAPTVLAS